ncbi:01P13-1 [Rhynchospora pubera]|uniref:01P13-1 n=1 Tax=Rhynchospora pubera TaxID=906938 RepID=A0AAV8DZJ5_9POAL|nr:01P13-1 [Rhynchospora pubera]
MPEEIAGSIGSTGTTAETIPPWSGLQGVDTSTVKLTTILLNGLNYHQWAHAVNIALEGRGLLEFITGEFEKPDQATKPKEYKQWRKLDCQVLTLIQNSIEPKIGEIFFSHTSSKDLWDAIAKHYGKRKNHSHIYHLKENIKQISQNQRPVIEYITDLKRGWEELKLYQLPTSDPNMVRDRENEQVYKFLSGLDDSFEAIRAQILLSAELPHLDDVMATVEGEETRRLLIVRSSASQERTEAQAMAVRKPNPRSGKGTDWCDNCKKEGHPRDKCWFLHPHLRPKWWTEKEEGKSGAAENSKRDKKRGFGAGVRHGEDEGVKAPRNGSVAERLGTGSASTSTREELGSLLAQLTRLLKPNSEKNAGFEIQDEDW